MDSLFVIILINGKTRDLIHAFSLAHATDTWLQDYWIIADRDRSDVEIYRKSDTALVVCEFSLRHQSIHTRRCKLLKTSRINRRETLRLNFSLATGSGRRQLNDENVISGLKFAP
jgi:hypothetical protein